MWKNSIIVFDTNLLLNLYRYTPETRDNVLAVMEANAGRIWLPYQVGWEYFNNRMSVIDEVSNGCTQLRNLIADLRNKFKKSLDDNYKRHPYIDRKILEPLCKDALKPILEQLDEWKKNDPYYAEDDTILKRLVSYFSVRIGEDFTEDQLNKLYSEGEIRYANQTPPGYMDLKEKKDRGNRHLYGDLIVGMQTIEKAKTDNCDVIFVSDDQKDDWYEKKVHGKSAGPRYELFKEFKIKSGGHRVLIYNQELFLKYANQYLKADVKDDVIKEVKEVADAEEEKRVAARRRTDDILREYGFIGESYTRALNPFAATAAMNWPKVQANFGIPVSAVSQLQAILEQQKKMSVWADSLEPYTKAADAIRAQPFMSTSDIIKQIARQASAWRYANHISRLNIG